MGIELYKHNNEAYEKIEAMFKQVDRVAIVHATGTGKSFISLKWLYENRSKKCLFLAPTYEIVDQLEQHIRSQGLSISDFPNLKCSIYPNFSRLSTDEIKKLHFDNIVLDEFHRCGAQEWGQSISTLLYNNPNAKVLGITATPIRYLDDNRNMAEELFHGNIASEISLTDAISRGILPMPIYISAIYSFKEDIDRIQSKINRYENSEYRETFQKKLDEAKRMLENAKGLPEIFERHIPNRSGRYIVFCRDYEHMQRMMAEANQWFSKVNSNVDIYSVYSGQGRENNKRNISSFENSTNDHIKLLFSIEILNEGVHVENVDGVIMLRPTISPNIYLQQLGRALSVGHNDHPYVFDIVNNINCHKSIYEVYEEVKKKILTSYSGNNQSNNSNVDLEEFKIIDELKQFSDFLDKLDSSLSRDTLTESKCELIVKRLIEFMKTNGRMPSRNGINDGEKSLYIAFKYYKRHYTPEQIKLLEENGIIVIPKTLEEKNEETIYGILEWLDTHDGRMPSGLSNDLYERSLYISFTRNKEQFTDEQIKLLESRNIKIESRKGMTSEDIIQKIIDEIIEFKTTNGRMPSVVNGQYEDSLYQRFIRNKNRFTPDQLNRLATAGIRVNIVSKEERQKKYARIVDKVDSTISKLIDFKNANGRMPSDGGETLEERSLYQLYLRTKNLYTPEQIKLLADNGIIIKEKRKSSIEEILEDSTNAIITFVIVNHKMPSGKSFNREEQSLYNSFKRNKLNYTFEQKRRLLEVGVPIQFNESDGNLIISALSLAEQIEFYKEQVKNAQRLQNEVLYNYYLAKLQMINSKTDETLSENSRDFGGKI